MYLDMSMDSELMRIWHLVHELSEQLAHNQKIAATLQSQADTLKNEAASAIGEGFNLRRCNTDIAQETFESELERSNAQTIIENQTLLHENKQLASLLKEYESTMDTVMTKFRNHALAASQHESTLTRHYEALLYTRDVQALNTDISSSADVAQSLRRLTHHLRSLLRAMNGEDSQFDEIELSPSSYDGFPRDENHPLLEHPFMQEQYQRTSQSQDFVDLSELQSLIDELESFGYDGNSRQDWAVEREKEIERLEKENLEIRRHLGIDEEKVKELGVEVDTSRLQFGSGGSRLLHGGGYAGIISRHTPSPPSGVFQREKEMVEQTAQESDTNGAPLQRAADLPRMAAQAGSGRRSGIFGRGASRPPMSTNLWINQPSSPAPPVSWPGGNSTLDLNR